MTTDRTAIRRRLAVRRTAHRPPWGGGKARGHRSIVAPGHRTWKGWSATVAATVAVGIGVALARAERERRAGRTGTAEREARRFGLLSDETAASGCRRIALGQLDLAIELLRGEPSVPPEEAVHETRKALKRVRALMRLLEGELGAKRARRERAILRDTAARLSGARDAEVMVSTLDALVARHPRKLGRRGVVELREALERERRDASARALGDNVTRERVAEELSEVRARVAKWKLPRGRSAAKLTGPGLEHIYRAGRTGRRRAGKRRAGPSVLHKWRKHVKDLRYAAEVLDVRERARSGSKPAGKHGSKHASDRVAKIARRADGLGEVLGEEHDLMLLAERVRAHKPLKRHRKRTRKRLLRAISRRRARLRRRALRGGERLYAPGPRRFVATCVRDRPRGLK
jgi:CHAD domain-containing protein